MRRRWPSSGASISRARALPPIVEGWSYPMLANRFGTPEERRAVDELFALYEGRMKTGERERALELADAWTAANSGS